MASSRPAQTIRLKDIDKRLLALLRQGDRAQAYLTDKTGYTRQYIHQRLEVLQAAGLIENIHARSTLYHIANDPIDEIDS